MADLFDFNEQPDEYAVMGNPITHSKSPQIHSLFASQTRQNIRYRAIQVDPGGFAQAVGNFFAAGGKGLNITVPFKQEAWQLADSLSERAQLAGAVNTFKQTEQGTLLGDNTDGIGLFRDLTVNLGMNLNDKKLLLVGAGGAARGVIAPLLDARPGEFFIANRTVDRAQELVEHFAHRGEIHAVGFEELEPIAFDIVINATSASLAGELPPLSAKCVAGAEIVYDMMYGAAPTTFMLWAKQAGAKRISDGLGMLVEQAAESFYIWRGINPETAPVIQVMREKLQQQR